MYFLLSATHSDISFENIGNPYFSQTSANEILGFKITRLSNVCANCFNSGYCVGTSTNTKGMFLYPQTSLIICPKTVLSLPPLNDRYTPSSPNSSTQFRTLSAVIKTLILSGNACHWYNSCIVCLFSAIITPLN